MRTYYISAQSSTTEQLKSGRSFPILPKDLYANGNPISVEDTTANTLRVMQWDEENRLQSLGDDGYVSRYTYNHAGERVIKSHGPTTVAFVNGAPQGILWHDKDNWTMYVSPYMVVNSDRFTNIAVR